MSGGGKMKKISLAVASSLALFGLSGQSYADAKSGVVLGGQIGYAKANADLNNWQADANSGNLFYGATLGFDLAVMDSLALGVESGVFYGRSLSKYDQTGGGDYKVSNLIVPVLGKIMFVTPIGINLFAKGGISYVNPSAQKSGSTVSIDWKSSWNFTAAGGVGYQLGPINIFAQYMHIFGKNDVSVNGTQGTGYQAKIDAVTAGVDFTF